MAADLFYHVVIMAGSARYDLSQDLSSLTIEESGAQADRLTINLSDPYMVFGHAFQEGMEVEVDLGTVDDHSVLFRGRIYRVNSDFPLEGVPTVVLHAYDNSMKMGLRRHNRIWSKKKLSQIVEEIASNGRYRFRRKEIKLSWNPFFEGNGIRQQDETDLAFLLRLAAEYACETYVTAANEGDVFVFKSRYEIMDPEPEVTLYHGRSGVPHRLLTFEPSSDVSNIQLPRVYSAMNDADGRVVEAATRAPRPPATEDRFFHENRNAFAKWDPERAARLDALIVAAPKMQKDLREEIGSVERIVMPTFTTKEALQARTNNDYSLSLLGMRASGSTLGNQRIHAQSSIGVADVGGRFSGKWFLTQVRHTLDSKGYYTYFDCQR